MNGDSLFSNSTLLCPPPPPPPPPPPQKKKKKFTKTIVLGICSPPKSINLKTIVYHILHTFLENEQTISVHSDTLKWYNDIHNVNVNPSIEQIVLNWTDVIAPMTSIQNCRLDLLLLVVKHYVYTFNIFFKSL